MDSETLSCCMEHFAKHNTATERRSLGNPEEISILDLAQLARELVGSESPIDFHLLPQDDPKVR